MSTAVSKTILTLPTKVKLLASLMTIFLSVFVPGRLSAIEPFFDVTTKIKLCPEYKYGFIVVDIYYRIGDNPQLHAPEILSSTPDLASETLQATLRLPGTYTHVPFQIVATCRSALGISPESNSLSISNCDRLAKLDTDFDGIPNNQEDTNCDNFFSPGDASNPDNLDTDGDGVRDLVEALSGTDATNPGSSPRPFIFSSASFDPDGDSISNPLVWRPSSGTWYIRDQNGNAISYQFGQTGDIPFTYRDLNQESHVGVIRREGLGLSWYFRGTGFTNSNSQNLASVKLGVFGDNVIPGAWERPGITSPAVARLFNNSWTFDILLRDGQIKSVTWGGNGDIPKPQDFDGDGLFDIAVYRPSTQTTYVIKSSDNQVLTYKFGSGTADHTVRGDYTGDGIEEFSFWEPINGLFTSLISNNGFDPAKGAQKLNGFYQELPLGTYIEDLPLSWNSNGNRMLYTVVRHATGIRRFYPNNDRNQPLQTIQWGLAGDSQG